MPTYEYTTISNLQDGPESEFEAIKREVLAKVNPDSHHCMVTRNGKPELVLFLTFSKTDTGEILVLFLPIRDYTVPTEHCKPSEVHQMNGRDFQWPEDQRARVGYYTSEIKRVED